MSCLTQIHEYKGQQSFLVKVKADALSNLLESAKIQSIEASNCIEGIITTDNRLKKIVRDKTIPKTRNEKEIAGYRDVLAVIHESYDYIPPKPSAILQLHRDLYKFCGKTVGGSYKSSDNIITAEQENRGRAVRFQPVSTLCIHPFNDGNERMSRLLILLLLYRSGYIVGKYISIEKLISDTKETYYDAVQASSYNWHEGTNDYVPFVI